MKYLLLLLLIGCASKPCPVIPAVEVVMAPVIQPPKVVKATPKPVVKRVVAPRPAAKPLILEFSKGRAYPIPKAFRDSMGVLCKAGKSIVLTGSADALGPNAHSFELSRLRVSNGLKAALKAGCKESQIFTRSEGVSKTRSLKVEVWK